MYKSLTPTQRDVLIQCLLLASHKPTQWIFKGQLQTCKPGQFKTSLESLKNRCAKGTTVKQIRVALLKLETWQFLACEGAKTGRIVTILNWSTYQDSNTDKGQTRGQRQGKDRATIKNVKNENKNKYSLLFDERWLKYPNKDGRKEALKHFLATVKTDADLKNFDKALQNYLDNLKIEDWKRPKNGKTFFNNWADYVAWTEPVVERDDRVVL